MRSFFSHTYIDTSYIELGPDLVSLLCILQEKGSLHDLSEVDQEVLIDSLDICPKSKEIPLLLALLHLANILFVRNKKTESHLIFNWLYERFAAEVLKHKFENYFNNSLIKYYNHYLFICIKLGYCQFSSSEYKSEINFEDCIHTGTHLLQEYFDISPENSKILAWQLSLCQARYELSKLNYTKALSLLNENMRSIVSDIKNKIPAQDKCFCLCNLVVAAIAEKKFDTALEALDMLTQFEGSEEQTDSFLIKHLPLRYHYKGWAHFMLGKDDDAIAAFQQSDYLIDKIDDSVEDPFKILQINFFLRAMSHCRKNISSPEAKNALELIEDKLNNDLNTKEAFQDFISSFFNDDLISELSIISPRIKNIFQMTNTSIDSPEDNASPSLSFSL